jgi:hypothetical protein
MQLGADMAKNDELTEEQKMLLTIEFVKEVGGFDSAKVLLDSVKRLHSLVTQDLKPAAPKKPAKPAPKKAGKKKK